ncbi:PAS domain-containing sensor histidine kinase [Wukongibacter baidiensis]|uniref:sensor histidine kinase n=1 Tax=Wukongibacter baidiensis TaxID=1723361 RepID=UPI003D7F9EA0
MVSEELVKNKEVLHTILDSIHDGVLVVDNDKNIIHANKRFQEMWKIPDEIFNNNNNSEIFLNYVLDQLANPEEFTAKVEVLYQSDSDSLDNIEFKDGRIFDRFTKPLLIDNTVRGRVWSFKDITLFKENEKKLKDKIAFQHKFINTIPNPAFIKDIDGKYIDCNTAYEKFLGKSKEAILNKGLYEVFPKELADKYSEKDRELFKNRGVQVYEHTMSHADGTMHDVLFNKASFTDADGNIAGLVGVFSDITEKKMIEKALYRSKERYRNLFQYSPNAIVVHSEGNIIFANQAAANLSGVSHINKLIGRSIYDFAHVDFHEIVKERISQIKKYKKNVLPYEQKLVRYDGTVIDVEVTTSYFIHEDKVACQTIVRDITKRKKEEKLRKETENKLNEAIEHNKLTTEFFANISHEFKTPLNIMLGTFQLLILTLKIEEKENYNTNSYKKIKIMQQNCYRLLRLVNNLIDITKIDSGYFKLNATNLNIVSLIENITLSVAEYIQDKDIKLVFDTNIEEKLMAVDPDSIERIILNLLSNAVKFTSPGGIIKVTVESKNQILKVSVKDSGIGIPCDKKDIIFDRFRQVDKLLTRKQEGSGIGLSLVKSLVEMHDGKISVKSFEGVGTEFILEFPIKVIKYDDSIGKSDIKFQQEYVERINVEFSDIYA